MVAVVDGACRKEEQHRWSKLSAVTRSTVAQELSQMVVLQLQLEAEKNMESLSNRYDQLDLGRIANRGGVVERTMVRSLLVVRRESNQGTSQLTRHKEA